MFDDLYVFWVLDQRQRLRAVASASGVIFTLEAFCELVLKKDRTTSGLVALLAGLAVMFLWPMLAGVQLSVSKPEATRKSWAVAFACSMAFALFPRIAIPVQASAISSQLRVAAEGKAYSVESLQSALELGARFRIPVDRNLIERAGLAVLITAPQAVPATVQYQSALRSEPSPDLKNAAPYPFIAVDPGTSVSDQILSRLKTDSGFKYFVVERNPTPKVGGFSTLMFSLNNPSEHWSPSDVIPDVRLFGRARESDGAQVGPVFPGLDPVTNRTRGSIFSEYVIISARPRTTIELGMFRFKNVVFLNSQIGYDGASTSLQNVYFVNCSFAIRPETPDKAQFVQALLTPGPTNYETYILPEEVRRLGLDPRDQIPFSVQR